MLRKVVKMNLQQQEFVIHLISSSREMYITTEFTFFGGVNMKSEKNKGSTTASVHNIIAWRGIIFCIINHSLRH